jgi:hypothetical protein
LINWVFFILNTINFAFIIRGSSNLGNVRQSLLVTNLIRAYALIILTTDILFISLIGESEKTHQPHSLDQKFKRAYPYIYASLDVIGLRTNPLTIATGLNAEDVARKALRQRFTAYIAFFLISIYLASHFTSQIRRIKADRGFEEEDYKKLFEYSRDPNPRGKIANLDEAQDKSVFRKRAGRDAYDFKDLIDYYEKQRFSLPFMIYRAMRWWSLFDYIALYGHVVSNFLIVFVSIQYSNSFYNCFNILCVCLFYYQSAQQVHMAAYSNFDRAGLQTQCDLKMAQLVTKRYKSQSFLIFLKVRRQIWNVQFVMLIFTVIASNPIALLDIIREKLVADTTTDHIETIAKLDFVLFWAFMSGLYHVRYLMGICAALVFERQCINWLKNRFGCTYFKL